MRALVWSPTARADRLAIFDYVEQDSFAIAGLVIGRIDAQVERLASFPENGGEGRGNGTRELVVLKTPYIVVYQVQEHEVRIVRVLHGAQRWPRPK